jgi:hypothetical protein
MVKVAVLAPESNVKEPPNSCARFAKVIVCEAEALNVMGARKLHDPEVLLLVQELLTVQDPAPDVTYAVAEAMLTLPITSTVEVPVARKPVPLIVRAPCTESALDDVAKEEPVARVRLPVVVSWLSWLIVPETVTPAKDWDPEIRIVLPAPVKVTELDVEVKAPVVTEEVSQFPAMVTTADPNNAFAPVPEAVRFPLKATVELVKVRVPDQVRFEATVVETDAFTVTLKRAWGTLIVPPDAFTRTVEVPVVKLPALEFMDTTVSVEPLAVSDPPLATVSVVVVMARFEPDVDKVVVPVPPCTVTAPAFRARALIVYVTVLAPLLKTTARNSFEERLDPANVIVWLPEELKVTVAVPADHEALVEAFVHEPDMVHAPLPNAMKAVAEAMFTLPVTLPLEAPAMESDALPERVRPPVIEKPVPADAPMVMLPAA